MNLVPTEFGASSVTAEDARQLTDRIKFAVEATWELVVEAYESRAWAALGYPSWDDYCTREFGSYRLRLPREERQETVGSLRDAGLSIRAIAAATGAGTKTVQRDIHSGVVIDHTYDDPEDGDDLDPELVELVDGLDEITSPPDGQADPAPEPEPTPAVTGTDGKSYPRAASPRAKRSSLVDAARNAGWKFRKATESLERIVDDDRFSANREQVADHVRDHLLYAIEVLTDLVNRLEQASQ